MSGTDTNDVNPASSADQTPTGSYHFLNKVLGDDLDRGDDRYYDEDAYYDVHQEEERRSQSSPDIEDLIARFGDEDSWSDREYTDEEIAEMQRDPDTIFPAHGTFNDPVPRKKEALYWRSRDKNRTNIGKQWQCRRYRKVRPQAIKSLPVTEPEDPELSLDDLACFEPEQREWLLADAFTA